MAAPTDEECELTPCPAYVSTFVGKMKMSDEDYVINDLNEGYVINDLKE